MEHLCENIKEAKKQCEDIKFEYGQVTSYLKDIQLVDRAPKEEQEKLLAAAKQIVELTKERKKSQKQEYKFTEAQRRAMDNYEDVVEDDIKGTWKMPDSTVDCDLCNACGFDGMF